ncbi:phosphatidylcholine:ceramide cholinephosphotransferase 2-like [Paramacrobiotus metropolitanus]|uniref:phosphatidylcholine:ceramide cholinephosphotransferase 2-like n=1 Tax=Paramacrobiotus metropolitanus TaxID=2943436 RepID=UPI002445E375|nr:phosphatidylcholine:ceramide cholinephosphotransferase 2-like [Paramacrobiotus metropolitanus]
MGTRLFSSATYHSRNGSFVNSSYTSGSDEHVSLVGPGHPEPVETVISLNTCNCDPLIKIDDIPLSRDSRSSLYDSVYCGENGDTHFLVETPDSKLECRGSHSRQSSTSSVSDFRPTVRNYPEEKLKTLLALGFLFVGLFCTTLALAFVHDRLPDGPPLPDVVFSLVPQWDYGLAMSEYLLMLCVYPTIILMAFHRHRWIVFRRVFVIVGLLYLGRSITMLVTAVPVANTHYFCQPKMNITGPSTILLRAWTLLSGFGMSINGKHYYCGDYIYSGHTCMLVLSALIYGEYLPRKGWIAKALRIFFYSCSTLGVILVSISRGHYTVDIVIAYVVTTVVFWIYHTICAHPQLKAFSQNNHLSRMWWFRFVIFFEENVPDGKLPLRYNYPFPWPKRCINLKWDYME